MAGPRIQRWVIQHKDKIIATDSYQCFTESSAHQKCAILQELHPDLDFKVVELTRMAFVLQ